MQKGLFTHARVWINCLMLLMLFLLSSCVGNKTMLVNNHQSNYSIVIRDKPEILLKEAASELQVHLEHVFKVKLPIEAENKKLTGKRIILGRNKLTKNLTSDENWKKLGREGFIIKTVGDELIIAGNTDRGTLNGVYSFLEDVVGVRWLTPTQTYYPELSRLSIKELNRKYIPPFFLRFLYSINARYGLWAARQRLNSFVDHGNIPLREIMKEPKLCDSYSWAGLAHTIYPLLCEALSARDGKPYKIEDVFKLHPEYFSEQNGKRKYKHAQLCFTHPEVLKLLIEGAKIKIKKNPKADFINVSLMDGGPQCECKSCKAAYKKSGSKAAVFFRIVNQIAEEIEKKYPDILIETIAYHVTQKPPEIKLRKNVAVRYCPIRMNYFCPLDEGKHNTEGGLTYIFPPSITQIPKQLKKWGQLTQNLLIWYYTLKLPVFHPNPNLYALSRNFKLMRDFGVKGFFIEDLNWLRDHELNDLRAYLLYILSKPRCQ